MTKIFVNHTPEKLSDTALAEHANQLIKYISGSRIVGLVMMIIGATLAFQSSSLDFYSALCGIGGGFFMAQGRLAVLAERIKRLEKQLEH